MLTKVNVTVEGEQLKNVYLDQYEAFKAILGGTSFRSKLPIHYCVANNFRLLNLAEKPKIALERECELYTLVARHTAYLTNP